jgi:hypothetical protein
MPGLGAADLLARVWRHARAGEDAEALAIVQVVLPQIVFSLQNSELFNWVEKRLLLARGVLPETSIHVRRATWSPDASTLDYGDRLNAELVALARRLGYSPFGE